MSRSPQRVMNREALETACGGWPCFHDAEVVWLALDRRGPGVELRVRLAPGTPPSTSEGHCSVPINELLVTFGFNGVSQVELFGFNEQNVLSDLRFLMDPEGTKVALDGIYGLTGSVLCDSVEVRQVERRKPEQR